MFSITEQADDDGVVLVVHGSLDLATGPALLTRGRRSVGDGRSLSLDLSDVDLVDAVGIGVLIGLRKVVVESGGSFAITAPSAAAMASFAAHEVDRLLAP
ncbi:MAG: STAS domain-containing protein [Actinomycetota bacterium]|nr:STAS domain-containing protein [Actinomycetota bacterium]